MRLALVLVLLATSVARAGTPTETANTIIAAQRALLDKGQAGATTLLQSMDPDGIVVSTMAVETPKRLLEVMAAKSSEEDHYARGALQPLFWAHPDNPTTPKATTKSTVKNLVAGGRADVVWFTFDLVVDRVTVEAKPFKMNHTFRITELVVNQGGWKVMLFHIDKAQPDQWDELPSAGGGPPTGEHFPEAEKESAFSELATSPAKLAKALLIEPSTLVLGSSAGDRGVGPAAAKLVGSWSKLKLAGFQSLQRTSKTWGFAVVRLDLDGKNEDQKMRMWATVIALPKPDGSWQVVTLHYSRIMW